jgi:hypothetical protein
MKPSFVPGGTRSLSSQDVRVRDMMSKNGGMIPGERECRWPCRRSSRGKVDVVSGNKEYNKARVVTRFSGRQKEGRGPKTVQPLTSD